MVGYCAGLGLKGVIVQSYKMKKILIFLGIILIGNLIHEGTHIFQSLALDEKINEVCVMGYSSSDGTFMNSAGGWVDYEPKSKHNIFWQEFPAYLLSFLVMIFLIYKID